MKEILDKLQKMSGKITVKNPTPAVFIMVVFIGFIFLGINMFSSQNLSPVFFGLIQNNRKSTVDYLQKIIDTDNFAHQIDYFKNIYGNSLKNEVFAAKIKRDKEINKLEQILTKNAQSRDILYSLYLLNKENKNLSIAERYFRKAKQVDPDIHK